MQHFFKVGGLAKSKVICIDHVPKMTHTETITEKHLLDIDEWLPVSGAPASNVGADEDSRGISNVESPLADGSTNRDTVYSQGQWWKVVKNLPRSFHLLSTMPVQIFRHLLPLAITLEGLHTFYITLCTCFSVP